MSHNLAVEGPNDSRGKDTSDLIRLKGDPKAFVCGAQGGREATGGGKGYDRRAMTS